MNYLSTLIFESYKIQISFGQELYTTNSVIAITDSKMKLSDELNLLKSL